MTTAEDVLVLLVIFASGQVLLEHQPGGVGELHVGVLCVPVWAAFPRWSRLGVHGGLLDSLRGHGYGHYCLRRGNTQVLSLIHI